MGTLETRATQLGILTMLLVAYGIAIGGPDIQTNITNLFAPFPSAPPLGPALVNNCSWQDIGCQLVKIGTTPLFAPLEIIGGSVIWGIEVLYSFANRISLFFSVIVTVFFGPQIGVASVPFVSFLFTVIFLIVPAFEFFRLVRGNSSGSTL